MIQETMLSIQRTVTLDSIRITLGIQFVPWLFKLTASRRLETRERPWTTHQRWDQWLSPEKPIRFLAGCFQVLQPARCNLQSDLMHALLVILTCRMCMLQCESLRKPRDPSFFLFFFFPGPPIFGVNKQYIIQDRTSDAWRKQKLSRY